MRIVNEEIYNYISFSTQYTAIVDISQLRYLQRCLGHVALNLNNVATLANIEGRENVHTRRQRSVG